MISAVAKHAVDLAKRHESAEEASRSGTVAKVDELWRSLTSAVNHGLRTPLAAARTATTVRGGDADFPPQDTAELLATGEESIDELLAVVGNLLDSSRLSFGAVRPKPGPVDLEETVQRSLVGISTGNTDFTRRGVERVKATVGGAAVLADGALLERVLANVIDNSLRYACGSPVRVTAGRIGDRVLIAVVDEGPGIPVAPRSRSSSRFNGSATAPLSVSVLAFRSHAGSSRRWAAGFRPPTLPAAA